MKYFGLHYKDIILAHSKLKRLTGKKKHGAV